MSKVERDPGSYESGVGPTPLVSSGTLFSASLLSSVSLHRGRWMTHFRGEIRHGGLLPGGQPLELTKLTETEKDLRKSETEKS